METLSTLQAYSEGNPAVTGGFPAQKDSDDGVSDVSCENGKKDQWWQKEPEWSFSPRLIPFAHFFSFFFTHMSYLCAEVSWQKRHQHNSSRIYSMRQKITPSQRHYGTDLLSCYLCAFQSWFIKKYRKETQKRYIDKTIHLLGHSNFQYCFRLIDCRPASRID